MANKHKHNWTLQHSSAHVKDIKAVCSCGKYMFTKQIEAMLNDYDQVYQWLKECQEREGPW